MANPMLSARQSTKLSKINAELVGEGLRPAWVTEIGATGTALVLSPDYCGLIEVTGSNSVVRAP